MFRIGLDRRRATVARIGLLVVLTLGIASPAESALDRTVAAENRGVALGDSITYGYPDPAAGWVAALGLVNAGVPGERTDQMLARLPGVLATDPNRVLIMGGTNDLAQGVAQAHIVANLRAIVDEVQAAHAEPVLLTIAPRSERRWVGPTDTLNDQIATLAASEAVRLVDVHAVLAAPDGTFAAGLSVDGIHPTQAGYAAMAALIRGSITSSPSEQSGPAATGRPDTAPGIEKARTWLSGPSRNAGVARSRRD